MRDGRRGNPSDDTFAEMLAGPFFRSRINPDAIHRAALFLVDDDFLRNIYETPRQITGIGSTQSGIGKTFARAMRRDKVFQGRQPFAEVGLDRQRDDATGRVSHQAAHSRKLANRLEAAFGCAAIRHHADRRIGIHLLAHRFGDLFGGFRPEFDRLDVLLIFSN